jgi:putative MATE family efflux protein
MGNEVTKLTQGSVSRGIVLFALPLLASGLIQQLYHTVDLLFMGRFVGVGAAAAVGASTLVVICVVGFFTGLSVGAGVVAATYFGAGDLGGLRKAIHSSMAASLVGGLAFLAMGYLLAPVFLGWLNTPPDILPLANSYIRIYFFALIPIVVYNVGAGMTRGLGNSKAPMIYQLYGGILNVAANAFFVLILGWGVKGCALATVLSNSLAALLVVRNLTRLKGGYGLRLRDIRAHPGELRKILYIGLPTGFQSVVLTFSNLVVQYYVNSLGVKAIAAFTAYLKVENFIYLPILAFGQAVTTFVGQNVGARQGARAAAGVRATLAMGVATTILMCLGTLAMADGVFGLFYADPGVVGLGRELIFATFPFYFLYVIIETLASCMRGAGKPIPPMVAILVNLCVVRIALLAVISVVDFTPRGVIMVYPITWLFAAATLNAFYRKGDWLPTAPK